MGILQLAYAGLRMQQGVVVQLQEWSMRLQVAECQQYVMPPGSFHGGYCMTCSCATAWLDYSVCSGTCPPTGGGYVGVRRVVRLLEHGDFAKRQVDAAIDANAAMLNLRVCIMR